MVDDGGCWRPWQMVIYLLTLMYELQAGNMISDRPGMIAVTGHRPVICVGHRPVILTVDPNRPWISVGQRSLSQEPGGGHRHRSRFRIPVLCNRCGCRSQVPESV